MQNFTYTFLPQDLLRGLFGEFHMDLPTKFATPDLRLLDPNDTIPSNMDPSTISYLSKFFSAPLAFFVSKPCTAARWSEDGKGTSLDYNELLGNEWMTIETVLLRIDTLHVTRARFPVHGRGLNPLGFNVSLGYDAAVCVLKYESWIIEAYNTSAGSPSALRIVGKGDGSPPLSPSGDIQGPPIENTRYLNATGKGGAYGLARGNGIYQIVRDEAMDSYYPSPIVGPVASPPTTFLLISIHSVGRFFH